MATENSLNPKRNLESPSKQLTMENKNFSHMSLGTVLYRLKIKYADIVESKDSYGNPRPANLLSEVVIHKLDLVKDDAYVNHNRSSYGNYYELVVPKEKLKQTSIEYEEYIYFCNKNDYRKMIRKFLLDKINFLEKEWQNKRDHNNKLIAEIRNAYWDHLKSF